MMAVVPHTAGCCAVWQDATHWIVLSSVPIARCLHHVSGPYPECGGFGRLQLEMLLVLSLNSCSRLATGLQEYASK